MRSLRTALFLLATGLIVTALMTLNTKADQEALAKQEFDFASSQITQKIEARLIENVQLLNNAAALFAAADTVTRQDWQTFTQHLALGGHSRAFRTWAMRPSLI
jgi:sensor domain CHASE-containing protein